MAYNIIELNEKLTTELRVLAKEMGIRRPDAYKKEELIYKILDEQAIAETKKLSIDSGTQQSHTPRKSSESKTNSQKNKSVTKKEETKEKESDKKEDRIKPQNQLQTIQPSERPKLVKKESSPTEQKAPVTQENAPRTQSEIKPVTSKTVREKV